MPGLGFAEFDTTMPWDHIVFWHWLALGALLAAIEMLAPGTFLLWLGLAAIVTGLTKLLFPDMILAWQLLIFSIAAIGSIYVGRRIYNRTTEDTDHPGLNVRGQQHVGREYVLESALINGRGRLKVADASWSCAASEDLPAGTRVRVTAIDGNTMMVEKITE